MNQTNGLTGVIAALACVLAAQPRAFADCGLNDEGNRIFVDSVCRLRLGSFWHYEKLCQEGVDAMRDFNLEATGLSAEGAAVMAANMCAEVVLFLSEAKYFGADVEAEDLKDKQCKELMDFQKRRAEEFRNQQLREAADASPEAPGGQ